MPNQEWIRLMDKGPANWTAGDVGMWLDFMNLPDYKISFIENCIAGEELLDLQAEDLVDLGVRTLGHRKRLTKAIAGLSAGDRAIGGGNKKAADMQSDTGSEISDADSSTHGSELSGVSGLSGASTRSVDIIYNESDRIQVKLYYHDNISVLSVKPASISLRELKRKVRKAFRMRMDIFVKDSDGDKIALKRTKDLKNVFRHTKPPIRIHCQRVTTSTKKSSVSVTSAQVDLLDTLMDATIMIDPKGTVLVFNKAAETLFGYSRKEVVGQNVKVLMAQAYAQHHDQYLARYAANPNPNSTVVGQTRLVVARHSSGSPLNLDLSVTESKKDSSHTFTATLRPAKSQAGGANQFDVLDTLMEKALVINEKGNILFSNKKANEFFGYEGKELLGQNVNVLMPSPYKENHSFYLNNYRTTGLKKIIDKSRDVLAELKDGSITHVNLSVSEQTAEDGSKIFTGIFREREQKKRKTVLAQQREVLHGLLVPAIIIDSSGIIQGYNRSAAKLTGYEIEDVLGQNVKMIMDPQHAVKHDQYLKNYLTTGQAKVIGKERAVFAKTRRGQLIKVKLSVTEVADGDKKFFTGMLHQV